MCPMCGCRPHFAFGGGKDRILCCVSVTVEHDQSRLDTTGSAALFAWNALALELGRPRRVDVHEDEVDIANAIQCLVSDAPEARPAPDLVHYGPKLRADGTCFLCGDSGVCMACNGKPRERGTTDFERGLAKIREDIAKDEGRPL